MRCAGIFVCSECKGPIYLELQEVKIRVLCAPNIACKQTTLLSGLLKLTGQNCCKLLRDPEASKCCPEADRK